MESLRVVDSEIIPPIVRHMKAVSAQSPLRRSRKARKSAARPVKASAKPWTPPDFKQWLDEDFGGKIMPFKYVDFLER